ncbi:hypothetical protein [Aquimarina sediminis]|uniref:hypothetical protein n=1 Tax=Aquimarina sediminis TaxID=2070536 RepID=UPI000FFF1B58|nr:hypothetical protein [Aquimarina sediminis]
MMNLEKMRIVTAILVLCIGFSTLAFDNNNSKAITNKDNDIEDKVREANILFKAGKVIEIAYATVEGGKNAQLNKEYFSKILPIAAKYEGKMLGSLQVTAVVDGEVVPQMIAIFEWPNIEARDKLLADKKAQKLFPTRDAILTSIKLAYFTVDEDVSVTFREDKTYEFFNAWLTPEAEKLLPKYFQKSENVKKKYGPPSFVASLKPLKGLPGADYLLQPHMAGIVEWNNTNAYYGLIADPEFKKVAPLLMKSLSRIDGIHAKFNFPQ